ncbi:MAG TPA: hypothetical protein VNE39_16740 [Planctomycetota bacterium]|nr:hypothetical protein [Planctomycetota bacterium]
MRPAAATSFAVLFLLAWPVLALCGEAPAGAIKVGDEVTLMSDGPGRTLRASPAVAFGKDVYLVAWQEGWHGDGGNSRVYAARVALDGRALDPKGIEIAPCKTGVQENPRVAFFGGAFLVVWQDLRNGKDCDVLGARVSPEGKVLDAQPIAIAAAPRTQAMPDVAADDKGFLAVWHAFQGDETTAKVLAARIGPDGAAGQPVVVIAGASPRIAWNGKEHLLLYSTIGSNGVMAAGQSKSWLRMDTAAKPLSKPGFMWEATRYSICAMPEEKGWLMVCHGGPPNWWGRSVAAQKLYRITPEGKRDSPSEDRSKGVPANWLDTSMGKKGHGTRGSANIAEVWPYGGSALAPDGQYCVAVWQRYHTGGASGMDLINGDILAARVDGWEPMDKDGVAVAASPADECSPALAGNGAGKLLCAYEKEEGGRTLIAVRTLQTQ